MSIKKKLGKIPKSINKEELIDLTKRLYSQINQISPDGEWQPFSQNRIWSIKMTNRDKYIFHLNHDANLYLEKAIKLIKSDPMYIDDVSVKRIKNKYMDLIIKIIKSNVDSDQEINNMVDCFISELKTSIKKYRILMPIEKLELTDLDEVKIGNVRFVPFSSLKAENEELSKVVDVEDENKIWGDVIIKAELAEAELKGQHEIERAINTLRIYIPLIYKDKLNIKIGFFKCDNRSYKYFIIDDCSSINRSIKYLGPFGNYILSKEKYDDLKTKYCLDEICGMLSKAPENRSDLENSIIMAIRWLGLGMDDEVVSDKFLKYAIALECLLITRGEKGDKTGPISKRAAFILGTTASECKSIESKVKLLYNIRSVIVHQGCEAEEEKIIKDSVQTMYWYSMNSLLELSKKTIGPDSWEDIGYLDKQIDEQTFAR